MNLSIFSHTQKSFKEEILLRIGRGGSHAEALYSWFMKRGSLEGFEDSVEPQAVDLVRKMCEMTDFSLPLLASSHEEEGTVKFILRLKDGLECESVVIPMQGFSTLCISSQIGCKRACAFCETGRMNLQRSLDVGEIVSQVFYALYRIGKGAVRNVVFMGMGEAFDNFDAVLGAVRVLIDPAGLGFGPSRITISTSGVVPGIYRMIKEMDPQINLAVSITAPLDELRNKLMPINRKWGLDELKKAMCSYLENPRRSILVQYVLLQGINDSPKHAHLLAHFLEGLRVKVNLIPYNAQGGKSSYQSPTMSIIREFKEELRARGLRALLRINKGNRIMAACGQLGNRSRLLLKRSIE